MTSDCVDTSGSTGDGSPGGSVSGEYNATLAALRFAGVPDERIIGVASAAAADAATWDVIVFPEFETCLPDAEAWWPVLTDSLTSGGRMIVTIPQSNSIAFMTSLGFVGSGSSTGLSSPYPYTGGHAFGAGLPTISSLNATSGWSWSGPDLEVLAADSSGLQAVWRMTAVFE